MAKKYIKLSTDPITASFEMDYMGEVEKSKKDRIRQWFFDPLRNYATQEVFVIFMVCLPLYEKYLRYKRYIGENEAFSEGHKVFNCIGRDLGISGQVVYRFWNSFRNGLCHMAMPRKSELDYALIRTSDFIGRYDQEQNVLVFNAFKFRDMVEDKVLNEPCMFRDNEYPFAKEIKIQ